MNTEEPFKRLEQYLEKEEYKGYDPYDTLNSFIPFKLLGKWGPILAIQFQKRNPVNIRPLIGIKKEINPKAFGLFLQAYSILYHKTQQKIYFEKAEYFYNWLNTNYSAGYSGKCWGYNFAWASPQKYMKPNIPSAVVTGFVVKGLFEFYKISQKKEVLDLIVSACRFLDIDLEKYSDETGLSISYTPIQKDVCYNASLLAAEAFAKLYSINKNEAYKDIAIKAVEFVIRRQKESGSWNYSVDLNSNKERVQIDFHQGYILESLFEIKNSLMINNEQWENAIKKGLTFYKERQFHDNGRSYWRIPKDYPVDIHNQAQGIITFNKLDEYSEEYSSFAESISNWTVENMQSAKGYFYYQVFKTHIHKITYMRWSQAWMFLAFANLK
jgi:hypothetical protein